MKTARVEAWRPPSTLEAPEAPAGYKHRWIPWSVMEYDDKNNVHKRRRRLGACTGGKITLNLMPPSLKENAGVIGVGGLVLARIPEEIADQRNSHYQ